jgi:uncharacterized protein (TIGR03032 family)
MDSFDAGAIDVEPARARADEAVEYSLSNGMVARLANLDVSLAFSSYQSGILYFLGRGREGAHLHQSGLPKPMGICVDGPDRLTLASGAQVVRLQNVLAPHERINDAFDACYVPRTFHLTGDIDLHDIGVDGEGRPIFVNTASIAWRRCRRSIVSRRSGGRRSSRAGSMATSAILTASPC